MASNRTRRIAKEIADIRADTHSQITAEPVEDDDVTHLRGTFPGPPGTPYEGGTYEVDIKIPNDYPFRPPVMKFVTKVWHPNISSQTVSIVSVSSPLSGPETISNVPVGRDLPRYAVIGMVAGADHQIRAFISAILAQHS